MGWVCANLRQSALTASLLLKAQPGNPGDLQNLMFSLEAPMAVNRPTGDNARKGAVKKRSQLASKTMGKKTWTKRDTNSGEFLAQKKAPAKKKFKGVRKER
jgi:hypothetical protein